MNNLKRTLALVATLALATTAFVGCGDDDSSSKKDSSSSKSDSATESKKDDSKEESKKDDSSEAPAAELSVPDTGDKMTILGWNKDEVQNMIDCFVKNNKAGITADKMNPVMQGSNGGEAAEKYATYFAGGDDVDLFIAEADWILSYINEDKYSAPLSKLGLADSDFANNYKYTVSIGTDKNGVLKGASWQAAPGGFCYRTDLAESLLGVKTPEEMQAKVKDWDTFQETAKTISEKSNKKTALTATIGGMWQVYSYNRAGAWVTDNKLTIEDSCTKFMEICKTMKANKYVTDAQQWAEDGSWYALGQDDSTMGYFFSTWCLGKDGQLEKASGGTSGKTYGKWNIVEGPSAYCWGGSWLCLSPKADNGTISKEFVKFMTVDEAGMKAYATECGEFVNNKAVMQSIVDAKTNKNAALGGQDQFAILMKAADGINLDGKLTPYDSTIKTQYIDCVNGYVGGTYKSVDDAIEAFKDKVAGKIADITVE